MYEKDLNIKDRNLIQNIKTFEYTKIIGSEYIKFGNYCIIDDFVSIYAKNKTVIGDYVHIASFTSISGGGELVLGDFCGISSGCRLLTGSDDFSGIGIGGPTVANTFRQTIIGKIVMERFSAIGANCVVLPGVTIGEGSTVGANSVVTKDLEPWGIYIGNKRVGERNKEEVLKNYEKFLATPDNERVGNLFR